VTNFRKLFLCLIGLFFKESVAWSEPSRHLPKLTAPRFSKQDFCFQFQKKYSQYQWGESGCSPMDWQYQRFSEDGWPLVYAVLGATTKPMETTLVFGGVHPDELTPIEFVQRFLVQNSSLESTWQNQGKRIVIAPLVNPDGFFKKFPTRVNRKGVDLNRNLPTQDWAKEAMAAWTKNSKNPRTFPGNRPATEQGTLFQMDLIHEFKPDKIISVHSPLGFLDFDGPGDSRTGVTEKEKKAKELALAISKAAKNFNVKDFQFFPGSLGNYAGRELAIPTLTFELRSANPKMVHQFWKDFGPGLHEAVAFHFRLEQWAHRQ
jgi:protein MpaA